MEISDDMKKKDIVIIQDIGRKYGVDISSMDIEELIEKSPSLQLAEVDEDFDDDDGE
jgi:hypothetical protein